MVKLGFNRNNSEKIRHLIDSFLIDGKKLIAIENDSYGRGRKLYSFIRRVILERNIRVFDRDEIRLICNIAASYFSGEKYFSCCLDDERLQESSVAIGLKIYDILSQLSDGRPYLLSLQDTEQWDRQTAIVVDRLLDWGSEKCQNKQRPIFQGALAIALEGKTCGTIDRVYQRFIFEHPLTYRLPASEFCEEHSLKPVEIVSCAHKKLLRLISLSFIPLTVDELIEFEGEYVRGFISKNNGSINLKEINGKQIVIGNAELNLEAVSEGELKQYHQKLLKIFESRKEIEEVASACFYHSVKAGDIEGIIKWMEPGIQKLFENGKQDIAVVLLEEVLNNTSGNYIEPLKELKIKRKLASLYARCNRPLKALETMLTIERRNLNTDDMLLIAQTAIDSGKLQIARQTIDSVLNGVVLDEKILMPFKILEAELKYLWCQYEECLDTCRKYLSTSYIQTHPGEKIKLLNIMGKVFLAKKCFRKAEAIFKENYKISSVNPELRRQEIISLINIAVAKIKTGHYHCAMKFIDRAIKCSSRGLFYREEAIALENKGVVLHLQRNYRRALVCYNEALKRFRALGYHELTARVASNIGELLLHFGDIEGSRRMLNFSRENLVECQNSLLEGRLLLLNGRIEFTCCNYGVARENFSNAFNFFKRIGASGYQQESAIWKAFALLMLGFFDEAESELKEIESKIDTDSPVYPLLLLISGKLKLARGIPAADAFGDAMNAFRNFGDIEGEIDCLIEIARLCLLRGEYNRVNELFSKINLLYETIRCQVPADYVEKFELLPRKYRIKALVEALNERASQIGDNEDWNKSRLRGKKSSQNLLVKNQTKNKGNNGKGLNVYDIIKYDIEKEIYNQFDPRADLSIIMSEGISLPELKKRIERNCIHQAMMIAKGNISRAAEILGMKRPRLSQLIKYYKINKELN